MTGIFRIIFFIFIGYILVKSFRFLLVIFKSVTAKPEGEKIYETKKANTKIDKKDIIDAQFEEIDVKENTSSNN